MIDGVVCKRFAFAPFAVGGFSRSDATHATVFRSRANGNEALNGARGRLREADVDHAVFSIGDAVDAIETILEKGERGVPYTVANEETFCTIREMAEALCAAHPESGSKVVFDFSGASARGFAPPFRMRLDSSRLRALGWAPKVGLMEMFDRMMDGMRR